ncbi:hypothetical protein [Fibrella forsythiae]|uniref:Uncharacterized protein n=1 Tax=Fibrella forsythiae TaxID=2817061 RepID=A0ABS3JTV7_9BACT|nr:hypothetical protein [Fibrella forsythiae]MBO0952888.1 hypothetical protein [Fibrella forsythiae]
MQATYHLKPDQVDDHLMQAIRELFKNEDVLTITVSSTGKPGGQHKTLFYSLFGSWQGQETGDELTLQIYSARQSGDRPVDL